MNKLLNMIKLDSTAMVNKDGLSPLMLFAIGVKDGKNRDEFIESVLELQPSDLNDNEFDLLINAITIANIYNSKINMYFFKVFENIEGKFSSLKAALSARFISEQGSQYLNNSKGLSLLLKLKQDYFWIYIDCLFEINKILCINEIKTKLLQNNDKTTITHLITRLPFIAKQFSQEELIDICTQWSLNISNPTIRKTFAHWCNKLKITVGISLPVEAKLSNIRYFQKQVAT